MTVLVWPHELLPPSECNAYPKPFTRGSTTLGGTKLSQRTDEGPWMIEMKDIPIYSKEQKRTFDAINMYLGGSSGRIAVPAWAMDTAPYVSGDEEPLVDVPHDDDTTFDDGTEYEQGAISVVSSGVTAIGATTIKLCIINAAEDLSGVRFSYEHALYLTGRVLNVDGDVWEMEITPSVRAVIPAGADLEFDRPTCLCKLQEDDGMQRAINPDRFEQVSVSFIEDTDYWNRLALGLEV